MLLHILGRENMPEVLTNVLWTLVTITNGESGDIFESIIRNAEAVKTLIQLLEYEFHSMYDSFAYLSQ